MAALPNDIKTTMPFSRSQANLIMMPSSGLISKVADGCNSIYTIRFAFAKYIKVLQFDKLLHLNVYWELDVLHSTII